MKMPKSEAASLLQDPRFLAVVIANGASLSAAFEVQGTLVAIRMSAAWSTGNITFQVSDAIDGTFQDLYDSTGTEVTATVVAARWVVMDIAKFIGAKYMKLRSGTSSVAVNQAADRSLTAVFRTA